MNTLSLTLRLSSGMTGTPWEWGFPLPLFSDIISQKEYLVPFFPEEEDGAGKVSKMFRFSQVFV